MEEAGAMQRVSIEKSSLAVATTGAPRLLDRVLGFADTSSFTGSGIPLKWEHRKSRPFSLGSRRIDA
jgi:hypothetical protein